MNASSQQQLVAVVSGGSSGIGKAFVARLHGEGYRVFTCARDTAKLRQLEQSYPGVQGFVCDVSDKASIIAFARTITELSPRIDLLISNAGGMVQVDFTQPEPISLDLTAELRSNLEGAINLIAAFLPNLRRAGHGSIVVVSSGYGLAPATLAPIYSAAKAGLHSLCKSLRRQLKPQGIRLTEVVPPLVDTPATVNHAGSKLSADAVAAAALAGLRRGRAEVYPGQARMLPLLMRLAPGIAEGVVANSLKVT